MGEREMTQEALAEAAGVSQQAVSMWLRNARRPGLHSLRALARALDVDPAEIFDQLDQMPDPPRAPASEQLDPEEVAALRRRVEALEAALAEQRRA